MNFKQLVRPVSILISALWLASSNIVMANDDAQLDEIYQLFLESAPSLDAITARYDGSIIHVGQAEAPLITGRSDFLAQNIAPLIGALDAGQFELSGAFLITRRVIGQQLAHDVGYYFARIETPDGEVNEQVRKFSWVFSRNSGQWVVITDFDAVPAPLDVIDTIDPVRCIGNIPSLCAVPAAN